jgi:hypothetical protein
MKKSEDNTKPEFFALWSVRQLQVECARLNQAMKESTEILEKTGAKERVNDGWVYGAGKSSDGFQS